MEESLFPHSRSMDNINELEEERRLCYVGITRARNKLFLTHTEFRRLYGQDSYNPPSNSINEIHKMFKFVRPKQTYKNSFYGSVVSKKLKQDGNEYGLGDRVLHSFGEGVILSMEEKEFSTHTNSF